MRKLVFMLAFVLVGMFVYGNEKAFESKDINNLESIDSCKSISATSYELFGRCSAIVGHFDNEGNLIGMYYYTWESSLSDIEGGCALDVKIIEFGMNTSNYF